MTEHHTFSPVVEALKDLPVAQVTKDVVGSVKQGKVTILTAETGSGKTLLANSVLADASDHQVVVLVPRRFLAVNAAETIASIGGFEVGKEVGYGIGSQADDRAVFTKDTKLVFATYGYALRSGLINTAKTIVCDEVHEAGVDTSLARAVLHKRLKGEPSLHVVEMSATLNAKKQAEFWQDIAPTEIFHAEGKAFPCEDRHVIPRSKTVEQTAIDLLKSENRKGIAIFRPGVKEVTDTVTALTAALTDAGLHDVEVAGIYGDMEKEERDKATAPPAEGHRKILVGTNVIESGVNIKWLDTGISDGKCKVPYYRPYNGARALITEELPQWRLVQQQGRVKRFTNGIFVLNSDVPYEARAQAASAEITRVSLKGLVMHAAKYGLDPTKLKYDAPVDAKSFAAAKKELKNLDLLNEDWSLTPKGEFASTLPLEADAASMLWKIDPAVANDAIELTAIVEQGGLRADFHKGHGLDKQSDMIDALKAFRKLGKGATQEECEAQNVSWKRYKDTRELIEDLHRRLDKELPQVEQRRLSAEEMTYLILKGGVNRLFTSGREYHSVVNQGPGYGQDRDSGVGGGRAEFAVGMLREIHPQKRAGEDDDKKKKKDKDKDKGDKKPEVKTLLTDITRVDKEVVFKFAAENPGTLTNITLSRRKKKRDEFEATWMGGQRVSFDIPRPPSPELLSIIGEESYHAHLRKNGEYVPEKNPEGKPLGVANSNVEEVVLKKRRGVGG